MKYSDMHAIATNIEHSSVTECFRELEREECLVTMLR